MCMTLGGGGGINWKQLGGKLWNDDPARDADDFSTTYCDNIWDRRGIFSAPADRPCLIKTCFGFFWQLCLIWRLMLFLRIFTNMLVILQILWFLSVLYTESIYLYKIFFIDDPHLHVYYFGCFLFKVSTSTTSHNIKKNRKVYNKIHFLNMT